MADGCRFGRARVHRGALHFPVKPSIGQGLFGSANLRRPLAEVDAGIGVEVPFWNLSVLCYRRLLEDLNNGVEVRPCQMITFLVVGCITPYGEADDKRGQDDSTHKYFCRASS